MQDDLSRYLERRRKRLGVDMVARLADAIDRHDPDLSKIGERIAKSFERAQAEVGKVDE